MTKSGKKYCASCYEPVMSTFMLCPKCGGRSFSKVPTAKPFLADQFTRVSGSNILRVGVFIAAALGAIWITFPIVHRISSSSMKQSPSLDVRLEKKGGVLVVPVRINDAINLNFIVDSGASDVSFPADVVLTLLRTGTLSEDDFLGKRDYTLADGTTVPSTIFRVRSLKVGNRVLKNVTGSVASVKGPLLLGQSFLSRFRAWHIDNDKQILVLE